MIPILLEYEMLRFIWWATLGVLLIGLSVMDGFDMGITFLNLIIGHNDDERRVILNTIGPVWDGNQVWLLLAGGAIFAAFPAIYATAFSVLYLPMLLLVLSLIIRPVSLEFRNKFSLSKRKYFDFALFCSGFIPPLIFGLAFGNLFKGLPFFFDDMHIPHHVIKNQSFSYCYDFLTLFNPLSLICGIVSLTMIVSHGAIVLMNKTEPIISQRCKKVVYIALTIWVIAFIIGGLMVNEMEGLKIISDINTNATSDPLNKQVINLKSAWNKNYMDRPLLFLIPIGACISAIATIFFTYKNLNLYSIISSALLIAFTIITAGVALFPFLLPNSYDANQSLTIWDSSSSKLTLWLMTLATGLFLPIVLLYTRWVYKILSGKVTLEYIKRHSNTLY